MRSASVLSAARSYGRLGSDPSFPPTGHAVHRFHELQRDRTRSHSVRPGASREHGVEHQHRFRDTVERWMMIDHEDCQADASRFRSFRFGYRAIYTDDQLLASLLSRAQVIRAQSVAASRRDRHRTRAPRRRSNSTRIAVAAMPSTSGSPNTYTR